nr:MAG TPA: TREPONEMA DENTICOLA VARIABLE PROTEIN 1 FUNCTION, PERIODONTAL DISEASE [Caudoviricetes sp.]
MSPFRSVLFFYAILGLGYKRLPFRGGAFWYCSGAGVFALNLNNPRSNTWDSIGFRSALSLWD